MDGWTVAALVVFAFALGVRVAWMWLEESKSLRLRLDDNDKTDAKQQDEINLILKQVNNLLTSKRVKRITIKRKKVAASG